MSRFARRKDATHAPVVACFRGLGCSWVNLDGPGAPDGVLGCAGRSHLVEIKPNQSTTRDKRQLAPRASQVAWAASWRGGPVHVVSSVEQAAVLVGLLRMSARAKE